MLINATQKEEIRIALVNGQKLYDLNIENSKNKKKKKSNIYKGKITRIEQSLEAVFVNYGENKNGFLPIKEISCKYIKKKNNNSENSNNISNLYKGQEITVQINKEERGNKGAFLTTYISLIGNYLILMPNNPKIEGISKKIEGTSRLKIKNIIPLLNIPKGMGVIIRTLGADKSIKALKWDLSLILKHWKYIKKKIKKKKAPYLIYQENNILIRIFKNYLQPNIDQIIIDNKKIYKRIKKYLYKLREFILYKKITFYKRKIPLFSYFQIESQIELAFNKQIRLPSGGIIIIEITEALTAIDINSSKNNKSIDIETTALNTNLEAIKEITKQLKIRNIGGLIVIDFIDMLLKENKKIIVNKLKKTTKKDKAKIQIGSISKFGLLEMSRQRINSSLRDSNYSKCYKCDGNGIIRNSESLSLSILRIIEEESLKKNITKIKIVVPIKIASYLLNKKRNNIYNIEKKNKKIKIIILPNKKINIPKYIIIKTKK